jgi:hypothetical protein
MVMFTNSPHFVGECYGVFPSKEVGTEVLVMLCVCELFLKVSYKTKDDLPMGDYYERGWVYVKI